MPASAGWEQSALLKCTGAAGIYGLLCPRKFRQRLIDSYRRGGLLRENRCFQDRKWVRAGEQSRLPWCWASVGLATLYGSFLQHLAFPCWLFSQFFIITGLSPVTSGVGLGGARSFSAIGFLSYANLDASISPTPAGTVKRGQEWQLPAPSQDLETGHPSRAPTCPSCTMTGCLS